MAIRSKLQLDTKGYDASLNKSLTETERKAAATSKKVRDSFNKMKTGMEAAGASGGMLGKLGNLAAGLTPVTLAMTAITAALKIAVEYWKHITMSAEEYARRLEKAAQESAKMRQNTEKQHDTDKQYIDRLDELSKTEIKSNESKKEARFLIEALTKRYGDLGLEIDAVTGKITGLDKAQAKMLADMQKQRIQAMNQERLDVQKHANAQAKIAVRNSDFDNQSGRAKRKGDMIEQVTGNQSLETQIKTLERFRDATKQQDKFDALQKAIDLKRQELELQRKITELIRSGSADEAEQAKKLQEATKNSWDAKNQQASKDIQKVKEDRETKQLNNEEKVTKEVEKQKKLYDEITALYYSKYGKSDIEKLKIENQVLQKEKEIEESKTRQLELEEKITQVQQKEIDEQQRQQENIDKHIGSTAEDIFNQSLEKAGFGKDAARNRAINRAESAKGGALTDEEMAKIERLSELEYSLNNLPQLNLQGMDIKTNSLTSRGGFAGGAVEPNVDRINTMIANNVQQAIRVLNDIHREINSLVNG